MFCEFLDRGRQSTTLAELSLHLHEVVKSVTSSLEHSRPRSVPTDRAEIFQYAYLMAARKSSSLLQTLMIILIATTHKIFKRKLTPLAPKQHSTSANIILVKVRLCGQCLPF
jgi:hypothetical protein